LTVGARAGAILGRSANNSRRDLMSNTATTTFDLERLTRAIEARHHAAQAEQYRDDAVVTIVDRISQPGAPRVIRGRSEIATWLEDTYSRDMTHSVTHRVTGEGGAAFVVACRYPDGTNVMCSTIIEPVDGLIARQIVVQAWDEEA
jgi:hypothetical protein